MKDLLGTGGFSKKLSLQRCVDSINFIICVKMKMRGFLASSVEYSVSYFCWDIPHSVYRAHFHYHMHELLGIALLSIM